MKILYVIDNAYEPHNNKYMTGLGGVSIITEKIAKRMAKKADCYMITYQHGAEEIIDGLHYAPHSKLNTFSGISPKTVIAAIKEFFTLKDSMKRRIKAAIHQIDYGYVNRYIKKLKPDIVNAIGATSGTMSHIDCCRKHKIPIVVSLHGSNNFDGMPAYLIKYEQDLCVRADKERIPVTVVSTGVKEYLTDIYDLHDNSNIYITLNGIDIDPEMFSGYVKSDIFARYGLDPDKKTVICSGTICKNKNQIGVLRAWDLLPSHIKKNYQLIFTGKEGDSQSLLIEALSNHRDNSSIHLLGFLNSDDNYYLMSQSSLHVLASIIEAFGLVIIESMACGVPNCTFSDISGISDIYNEKAMILAEGRTDESLANAIQAALEKAWDREAIIEHSKKFSMDNCVDGYLKVYKKIIKEFNN